MVTPLTPKKIEGHSPFEMLISWNSGEQYVVPYVELRFACPCAGCVDEHTGRRTLLRENISPEIKPTGAEIVGRYAVQFHWNDGHATGMFHFDRLHALCQDHGRRLG